MRWWISNAKPRDAGADRARPFPAGGPDRPEGKVIRPSACADAIRTINRVGASGWPNGLFWATPLDRVQRIVLRHGDVLGNSLAPLPPVNIRGGRDDSLRVTGIATKFILA